MEKIFIHVHKKFAAVFSSDQFLMKRTFDISSAVYIFFFDWVKIHRLIKLTQLTDATAVESKSSYFDITVK